MKPMFWHLRRKGILVMFFSINSEEEVHRALGYSIDGFITDEPTEIRRIMDSQKGREDTFVPMMERNLPTEN